MQRFVPESATVDNIRREEERERLLNLQQISEDSINPLAFEQVDRLVRSLRPIDAEYRNLTGKFSELAGVMRETMIWYEESTQTDKCKEVFDKSKRQISSEAGAVLKKLLDYKPNFIERTKYQGKSEGQGNQKGLDLRAKRANLDEALGKCEFKKALNIIEDKSPVNVIDGHVMA